MIERFKFKGQEIIRLIDDINQRRSIQFGVDKARLINFYQKEIAEFIVDVEQEQDEAKI